MSLGALITELSQYPEGIHNYNFTKWTFSKYTTDIYKIAVSKNKQRQLFIVTFGQIHKYISQLFFLVYFGLWPLQPSIYKPWPSRPTQISGQEYPAKAALTMLLRGLLLFTLIGIYAVPGNEGFIGDFFGEYRGKLFRAYSDLKIYIFIINIFTDFLNRFFVLKQQKLYFIIYEKHVQSLKPKLAKSKGKYKHLCIQMYQNRYVSKNLVFLVHY